MAVLKNPMEPTPLLWLWIPWSILVLSVGMVFLGEAAFRIFLVGESGFLEVITLFFLAMGIYLGARMFLSMPDQAPGWLRWWLLLIILGAGFFLGEEASWGQHIFQWETGDQWANLNQQGETNLHNLSGLGFIFDQLPRNLLTAAALLGGVLVPFYQRFRRRQWVPADANYWLWPTRVCTPAAFLAVFVSLTVKLIGLAWTERPEMFTYFGGGELKECYLAFFIMLYLLSLRFRLTALYPRAGSDAVDTPGSR